MWRSSSRLPRSEEVSSSVKVTPFLPVVRHTAPGEDSPSGQWPSLRGHGMFRTVPLAPSEEAPGCSRAGRHAAASGLLLCLRHRHRGCAGLTWRSGPAWSQSCTGGPGRQGVFRPMGSCPLLTQQLPERHTPRLADAAPPSPGLHSPEPRGSPRRTLPAGPEPRAHSLRSCCSLQGSVGCFLPSVPAVGFPGSVAQDSAAL